MWLATFFPLCFPPSIQEDLQERAGPFCHLYYLLDPMDDRKHSAPSPHNDQKPPLPNHLPPTSPAHRANSLASNDVQRSVTKAVPPAVRPKAYSHSGGTNGSHSDSIASSC